MPELENEDTFVTGRTWSRGNSALGPRYEEYDPIIKNCKVLAYDLAENNQTFFENDFLSTYCTYMVRFRSNPPNKIPAHGMLSAGNTSVNTYSLSVNIELTGKKSDWLELCNEFFPGARGYTAEENRIYSQFIKNFFEAIEI